MKYDKDDNETEITKEEFDLIKQKKEEKEYLNRDEYSRFEILEIR